MKINKNQSGFTLLQILIYVAILAGVMSGFVVYSLNLGAAKNRHLAQTLVNENAVQAISFISGRIRQAESVVEPNSLNSSSRLELARPGTAINDVFYLDKGRLYAATASGTDQAVTDELIEVTALNFSNRGPAGRPGSIAIELDLKYRHDESRAFRFSGSYRSAASTRNR